MGMPFRFPVRFKILLTMLVVITAVMGIITYIMTSQFHADKMTYIHDLASVVALNTAEESNSILSGYQERLQGYARILNDRNLSPEQKRGMFKELFGNFRDFLAVTIYEDGKEKTSLYDIKAISAVGLAKKEIIAYRKKNPPPFDTVDEKGVTIESSPVSDKMRAFTMAVAYPVGSGGRKGVLAALFRLDGLLHVTGRSRVFETFLVTDRGTLLAHTDPEKLLQTTDANWLPKSWMIQSRKSEVTTLEYVHEKKEMIGGFASVEFGGLLAGVQIPKAAAYVASRSLLTTLTYVSLGLLLGSTLLSLFWSRRVTNPIMRLYGATKEVGKGKFDVQITPSSSDEIADLAFSFNQMANELYSREEALQRAQEQLIQSEKMAAFGQLGAGIAHEVKNPLAGILGIAQLARRSADRESPLQNDLAIIEKEARRCKTIIENLMKFARQEKVAYETVMVNKVVEETKALLDHQLGIHQVRLETELSPDLPPITGNANQLQQVLMNLVINAQQALDGQRGTVRIVTSRSLPDQVEIRVSDTGPGIPEEIQSKLFEPFFTTKPAGKGTGLGLSVTYGIIRDHKGEIRVESEPGEGAVFIIRFPVEETVDAAAPEAALT
ncbi:MAG: HAMP domain-containing protein [Deltaproteobacteria bacterium]|nr:HAMP domain-containing protein [Deltaproteobacteria bacterium]